MYNNTQIPPTAFQVDDLEPFLSQRALQHHYEDHHHGEYGTRLAEIVGGTKFAQMTIEDIVRQADGELFRNAAQVWNHDFYWRCIAPPSPTNRPSQRLLSAIEADFRDFHSLRKEFKESALDNFGSGWTWLIRSASGELKIANTLNAITPLVDLNSKPLLVIDVWEHAYYIDYQGNKAGYIDNFWAFTNWHFVNHNFNS